jgi:hypothetical protein
MRSGGHTDGNAVEAWHLSGDCGPPLFTPLMMIS